MRQSGKYEVKNEEVYSLSSFVKAGVRPSKPYYIKNSKKTHFAEEELDITIYNEIENQLAEEEVDFKIYKEIDTTKLEEVQRLK